MSDDRWLEDEANANGVHPYPDRAPPPGVRPFWKQPDRRGPPTPEEIESFIAKEFGDSKPVKKRLIRPEGWDEFIGPIQQNQQEPQRGDAYEPPDLDP